MDSAPDATAAFSGAAPGRLRGTVLAGRYQLAERLGAGGMASIYRARDRSLDRDVAVKILHAHLADDPGLRERFSTEGRHAAKLLHPNIVNVFDQGVEAPPGEEPLPFLVMEFVDGPSLRDMLDELGRLSPGEALSVVEPVARALARAHAGGVVHRDVKPENVLVAADGTPKVADFGIARAIAETSHTQTGTLIGSVHYMAPELVDGKPATPATDQYALGVLLYELLTGRQPLPGDSPMAVALRHAREAIPAPSAQQRDVPAALDAVVARATAADPTDRYPDLPAFVAALRAAVPQGPSPVVVGSRGANSGNGTLVIPPSAQETVVVPAAAQGSRGGSRTRRARRRVDPTPKRPTVAGGWLRRATRRRGTLLAISALLAVLGGGAAVWATVIAPPVEVPALVGLDLDAAAATLAEHGLTLEQAGAAHSREIAEGLVVGSDPEAGQTLRRGRGVEVVTSLGPAIVAMPEVTGLTLDEALEALEAHAFAVEIHHDWHDHVAEGLVAGQLPASGEPIAETAEVIVNVSRGVEQVTVPDLSGMDRKAAEKALAEAKLTAGFVEEYSDTVPKRDAVIRQSVAAGETVAKGTTVTVTVSKGPVTFRMPDVEGKRIADARAQLEALDLQVRVVETARPQFGPFRRGAFGRVEVQDPQPGTTVRRGQRVDLYTYAERAEADDD